MKKTILVLRGRKTTTKFAINGNKTIDLKPLYKSFTNPEIYSKNFGVGDVEVFTQATTENVFSTITNNISVDGTGQCKLRAEIVWEDGEKQRIEFQCQLDISGKVITEKDVKSITNQFFSKVNIPATA